MLGTKSVDLGELKFKAHDEYEVPAAITITRESGKWYVSFSQAVFDCQSCGFTENADTNASLVIKKRGIEMLVSGVIAVKHQKRAMRLRKKETLGREPAEVTHGEKQIRHALGTTQGLHASMIRETPTATM